MEMKRLKKGSYRSFSPPCVSRLKLYCQVQERFVDCCHYLATLPTNQEN